MQQMALAEGEGSEAGKHNLVNKHWHTIADKRDDEL